jgi:hypothetical protein
MRSSTLAEIFLQAHWQRYLLKYTGRDFCSSTLAEIFDEAHWQRYSLKLTAEIFAQELYQIYSIQLLKHIIVTETRSTTFADEFAEMVKGERRSATLRQR